MLSIKYTGKEKKQGCSRCSGKKANVISKPGTEVFLPTKAGKLEQISVRTGQILKVDANQAKVLLAIKESDRNVFKLIQ